MCLRDAEKYAGRFFRPVFFARPTLDSVLE